MKRALDVLCVADLFFLLFIALSSMSGGALYYLFYLLTLLVPIAALALKREEEKVNVCLLFKISHRNALVFLPFIFPVLLLIFGSAYLSSLVMSFLGYADTAPDVSGNIFKVMLDNVLLPAVTEEAIFRLLPLVLLSKCGSVKSSLFSALLFALAHASFFAMPYAFLAGVIFYALDFYFESILPSLVLHLLNNLLSVIFMRYYSVSGFSLYFVLIFLGLSLLSIAFLFLFRKRIFKSKARDEALGDTSFSAIFFVYALAMLTMAAINLLGGSYA